MASSHRPGREPGHHADLGDGARNRPWRSRAALVAVAGAGLLSLVGGGVYAATQASDGNALRVTRPKASRGVEQRVNKLLAKMTLDEKLQQLQLLSDGQINDAEAAKGVGSVFSLTDPAKINHFQHVAVEQSRLHIPILFAYDTIHGYRTIFPTPLAEASSFDPTVAASDDTVAARETAAVGIKQIYSPMVDVSHEPRWGRIVEGSGEDPYLGSVLAAARVRAAQGTDYSKPDKVVTSVKHYVGYGQPEAGREYNTTDFSERRLHDLYLPPFKAAIDAGADTVMCSFNSMPNGPGCANHHTETDILKRQWGFDGFIESDYTAIAELRACPPVMPDSGPCGHGVAADGPGAAAAALNAGTDSEMVSTNFRDFGKQLVASGRVPMSRIDDAVRRILRVKFRAGLFEHPYVKNPPAETDPLPAANRAAARAAARKSMVLLKNSGGALPIAKTGSIAVVGPLADDQHDMLGAWWGRGQDSDAVTVLQGIKNNAPAANVTYAQGCDAECTSTARFGAAQAAANAADVTVLVIGEARERSGEAAAQTNIDLPGHQQELVDAIKATGKPFVVVLMNGRPLTITDLDAEAPAILEAWHGGVEAGNAVADLVLGDANPGGKLPVTFPRNVGQVPIFYNHEPTGRPADVPGADAKYSSRYTDSPITPLYPFGFGLSYTTFSTGNLRLSSATMPSTGSITASVDVKNTGGRAGDEVVQLYIHDPVASISQPVRRLRGFKRVHLAPGESRTVTFRLDRSDVEFSNDRGREIVEPGRIDVYAGDSSLATDTRSFRVTGH
jgi:beta-glucosidase